MPADGKSVGQCRNEDRQGLTASGPSHSVCACACSFMPPKYNLDQASYTHSPGIQTSRATRDGRRSRRLWVAFRGQIVSKADFHDSSWAGKRISHVIPPHVQCFSKLNKRRHHGSNQRHKGASEAVLFQPRRYGSSQRPRGLNHRGKLNKLLHKWLYTGRHGNLFILSDKEPPSRHFMKDFGEARNFLGTNITMWTECTKLSMDSFIKNVPEDYVLHGSRGVKVPADLEGLIDMSKLITLRRNILSGKYGRVFICC